MAENRNTLKVIPLGGLDEIGMNMTVFEYGDSILVVDCGMSFPTNEMLGIDLVIPDITYLKDNIEKIKGVVITHGHEDHIGALPFFLNAINVPVYATKLTMALIEHKLEEREITKSTKRKIVKYGQTVTLGDFKVEFIRTNHSIADAAALAITTPLGTIVHTGDFKVDFTPVYGDPIDLARFAELGKKGVLALLADSTNAVKDGHTMSERTVGKTLDRLFEENKDRRILVATFASNVDRVQQIINVADKFGRKVVVEGRSMVNIIDIAGELGYIQIPEGVLIDISQMSNYAPEKLVLITTGSQGESMAALSRMAADIHKKVSISSDDTIIFSSSPIPGNEKPVALVMNELAAKGARVLFQDTHVSGHACKEDLKLIYSLVRPKHAVPVHGEYRHLAAHAQIAQEMGIPEERVHVLRVGNILEFTEDEAAVIGMVSNGKVLVDGLGVGDVGNIVLRDRQNLSQNGIIVVVLTLNREYAELAAGPDIVSRGFVYVREADELIEESRMLVLEAVQDCLDRGIIDWGKLKSVIKDTLSDHIWKKMKRTPVILPIIMEI